MNILILTDIEEDNDFINIFTKMLNYYKDNNYLVNIIYVNDAKISSCLACYTCWVKTPGICQIQDQFCEFTEKFYKADKLIVFSKILFGCYSEKIKCYLERLLINMLPFFEYRNKKMYHSTRYLNIPEYIMVGYSRNACLGEQNIFFNLVKNNAANIKQEKYIAVILTNLNYTLRCGRGYYGTDNDNGG